MSRRPSLSPGLVRTAVLAGVLAVLGLVMVVVGWTEEHLWQSIMLQLAWLVFDAAIFVVLWHVIRDRGLLPARTERFRACWLILLGGCGLGLLLYVLALATQHSMLTPLGQLCIAAGLGTMALYLAATSLRSGGSSHLEAVPDLGQMFDDADPDEGAPLDDLISPRRAVEDDTASIR